MRAPQPDCSRRPSCAFCGYPVPESVSAIDEHDRQFCSMVCCEAFAADDEPFVDALGFKRRSVGVAALEAALPGGIPGNTTILVSGEEGTRLQGVLLETVWRTLQRGEPAVIVSIDKSPLTLVDSFLAHGWNVLPHLEENDLAVVDLFTKRLSDKEAIYSRENRWNQYLQSILEDALTVIRDPSDVLEVANQLDNTLDDLSMTATGVVAVDYLSELATFTQELRAAQLLKELRALVSQSRYVPLFAGASRSRREDLYPTEFPHDHEYLFDGIVDLHLNDELIEGERIKELSVRKMDDAPAASSWFAYEFRPPNGYVTVDPFEN